MGEKWSGPRKPSGRVRNVAKELLARFQLRDYPESRLSLVGNPFLIRLVANWPLLGVKWHPSEPPKVELPPVLASPDSTETPHSDTHDDLLDGVPVPFLITEGEQSFWDVDAIEDATENEQWEWLWQFTEYLPHRAARSIGASSPEAMRMVNQAKTLRLILPDGTITDGIRLLLQGVEISSGAGDSA